MQTTGKYHRNGEYARHILTADGRALAFVRHPDAPRVIYVRTTLQGVDAVGVLRVRHPGQKAHILRYVEA